MLIPDRGIQIERRPKIVTTGLPQDSFGLNLQESSVDTADPSLTLPIVYPNGVKRYRTSYSGMRFSEFSTPEGVLKREHVKVTRSRGFYKDGTEMTGPYHLAAWPWDAVIHKNNLGQQIALGGVMEQPRSGVLPSVREHNYSRSRWWGIVKHIQVAPGVYEEHIYWQGPVNEFNVGQGARGSWMLHGYGGTLRARFNPQTREYELVKTKNGNYILDYERVSEERTGPNGEKFPWVTQMYSREFDPSLTKAIGPEFLSLSYISPKTLNPFRASRRGEEDATGYLIEGGNVHFDLETGITIKAFSAGDYVRDYGIYLSYQPRGADPLSQMMPVMDANGELIDFASTMGLRELMDATWVGRPLIEYAPDGSGLWLKFHFVPKTSLPPTAPITGWPSEEDFIKIGRITAEVPIKITYDHKGLPHLELDIATDLGQLNSAE
jgi:hypothetical protein